MSRTLAAALSSTALCLGLAAGVPAAAQAFGETTALPRGDCMRACLEGFVKGYVAAMQKHDPSRARLDDHVRFTENSVEMPIGEGLWATVSDIDPEAGMIPADPETGNVAWFGHALEHGKLVYLAIRLKVDRGKVTEAETVIARKGTMPLIMGDGTVPHNPAWFQALTPEHARPRPRLRAAADSYFNTVEYNDGEVFARFQPDCSRLENGISTTAKTSNSSNSASVAEGCEAQFMLGIYRINKQLRERRFPLVDVERGIVVGTTFFDHANYFDEYKLTDGRTMKTLLKWPNSLSIMEAFKIVDGKIAGVESIFVDVPYHMPSPWPLEEDK